MAAERRIVTESGEFEFPDDNRVTAVQILRLSFEFANADAALAQNSATSGSQLATSPPVDASSDIGHFIDLKNQTAHAIQNATQEVGKLKKRVGRARGTDRTRLQAALDEAQSRLELLTARFSSIQTLANFAQSTAGGKNHGDDLASTIDDLAQTLPELSNAANSFRESQDPNFRPSSNTQQSGILGTWSEVSTLKRKLSIIDEATRVTDALALSAQSVRQPSDAFRTRLIRSCVLGDPETDDLSRLRARKAELDTLTAELNLWSPAIVALDKQKILLALYKSHHAYWRSTLDERYRQAWKKLVIRVLIVLLIMALLAGIGEFSRRVTLRHIQDPNRRRRLAVGQRVLILLMVLLVAAFSLASDLSSLATFLALVTAGLAVALQNVILASLGYLSLVGRLGIRIGDLVQISGVTGVR